MVPIWLVSIKGYDQEYSRNINLYILCHVLSLNLVGPCAAESLPEAQTFFGTLNYVFFSGIEYLKNQRWVNHTKNCTTFLKIPKYNRMVIKDGTCWGCVQTFRQDYQCLRRIVGQSSLHSQHKRPILSLFKEILGSLNLLPLPVSGVVL